MSRTTTGGVFLFPPRAQLVDGVPVCPSARVCVRGRGGGRARVLSSGVRPPTSFPAGILNTMSFCFQLKTYVFLY